ncbi:MAG: hypothetical protein HRU21_03120 [Pseudomonadales bacterium]|nr:hypothetical protein [Pseudomonadales bacterium]
MTAVNRPAPLYKNFRALFSEGFSICWGSSAFITVTHIAALMGIVWLSLAANSQLIWAALAWAIAHALLGSIATTVYSHRMIAHNAVKDIHPAVHLFFCGFAQCFAAQGSVRKWAAEHVIHHGVDRHGKHQLDPYSATWFPQTWRNFIWSHMLTFYFNHPRSEEFRKAYAVKNHPILVWQNRYYLVLLFGWNMLFPLILGAMIAGLPMALALFFGAMLGMILCQHNTWTVNSITHLWGFTRGLKSSAVNNYFWLGPLGEGNHHGDHHDYPRDYRNGFGLSGWLLDPTRYVILALKSLGLVKGLQRASKQQEAEIIAKRKLVNMQHLGLAAQRAASLCPETSALFEQLEAKVLELKQEWIDAATRFEQLRRESKLLRHANESREAIAEELRLAKEQMRNRKDAFMSAVKSFTYQSGIYAH